MTLKLQIQARFLRDYGIKVVLEERNTNNLSVMFNQVEMSMRNIGIPSINKPTTEMQVQHSFDQIKHEIRNNVKGTKGDPVFTDLAEMVFDIEATLNYNGKYMVVNYLDRHTKENKSVYFQHIQVTDRWAIASSKLKGISEILMAGMQAAPIIVSTHGYYNMPKVNFEKNTLDVPSTDSNNLSNNNKDLFIRTVKFLEQSAHKIVFSVEEVRLEHGESDVKYRNSVFTATNADGSPIILKREDIKDDKWWGFKINSAIDFEQHPLNTEIHEHITEAVPKFVTDSVYITSSERIWMNTKSGWVLVNLDYVRTYGKNIIPEPVMLEVNAYLNIKSLIK